jgi:hypothetical protein
VGEDVEDGVSTVCAVPDFEEFLEDAKKDWW